MHKREEYSLLILDTPNEAEPPQHFHISHSLKHGDFFQEVCVICEYVIVTIRNNGQW